MPQRIQRKRAKGWRMPPNTVSVTRPGKWGNPFSGAAAVDCVARYRKLLNTNDKMRDDAKRELYGKNLACWCALDQPCHADVLLDIANR